MSGSSSPVQGGAFFPEDDHLLRRGAADTLARLSDEQLRVLREQLSSPAVSLAERVALPEEEVGAELEAVYQMLRGLRPQLVQEVLVDEERFRRDLDEYLRQSPPNEARLRQEVIARVRHCMWQREEELDLSGLEVSRLPEAIGQLTHLKTLNLNNCHRLSALPISIGHLERLQSLWLEHCRELRALPPTSERLQNLQQLSLFDCPIIRAPPPAALARLFPQRRVPPPGLGNIIRAAAELQQQQRFENEFREPAAAASLRLTSSEIRDAPRDALETLGKFLETHPGLDPEGWRIDLVGAHGNVDAVDMGGVKRDVIYQLVQALFDRGNPGALPHYGEPATVLPAARSTGDELAYTQLGSLLSVPLRFPAPIGGLFAEGFFAALSAALNDPELREPLALAQLLLARRAYQDMLEERVLQKKEPLSEAEIEMIVQRLEEVDPKLALRARLFYRDPSQPANHASEEMRVAIYLELHHPQLAGLMKNSVGTLSAVQLQELTPVLERHDPTVLPDLQERLNQAEAEAQVKLQAHDEKIDGLKRRVEELQDRADVPPENIDALNEKIRRMMRMRQQLERQTVIARLNRPQDAPIKQRVIQALIDGFFDREDVRAEIKALQSPETLQQIVSGLQEHARANRVYLEVGNAVQKIAVGVLKALARDQDISLYTPECCRRRLEGDISIEALVRACPLPLDLGQDAQVRRTYDWLMRWIQESSPNQRREFAVAVTGSGALAPPPHHQIRLNFQNVSANRLPVAHTCIRQLDLPLHYADYEDFKVKLERFLRLVGEGERFGIA